MILLFFVASFACKRPATIVQENHSGPIANDIELPSNESNGMTGNGALLLTRFKSFAALKEVVEIQYGGANGDTSGTRGGKPWVRLTHRSGGQEVTSILKSGISQIDFTRAIKGSIWDKMLVALRCPYAAVHKNDLMAIENLGRRRPTVFGKGDIAFYDLAETMVHHISDMDLMRMPAEDLSEKGYLNTFNHIIGQAFMTSIFSERAADFVADVHERYNMPELITGHFTEAQLADLEKGPVDNYLDIINNEWGQELGKVLRKKYNINRKTIWTPELLANYLNDIKSYHSWVFQIGFIPFKPTDDMIIRFTGKMNMLIRSKTIFG